jgi:hypothetical protein
MTISLRYITEPLGGEGCLFTVVVSSHRWQVAVLAKSELYVYCISQNYLMRTTSNDADP